MGPKKLTDEEKEKQFDVYKASPEWTSMMKFVKKRQNIAKPLEMDQVDITEDYQPYLDSMYELFNELKVPGRKARSYEQMYVRTMFFPHVDKIKIAGKNYDISNNAKQDMWNCRTCLVELYNFFDPASIETNCTFETFQQWKKELFKHCKEWDKLYTRHIKATFPEMNNIHMSAMAPLIKLMECNLNFTRIDQMLAQRKPVPIFRVEALENIFSQLLSALCQIFMDHGDLKDSFGIDAMLGVLKISKWREVTCFSFYLIPLDKSIAFLRKTLLEMQLTESTLKIKYRLQENTEL